MCLTPQERGLVLSEEKTKITHIEQGFDFLGFNIRKYRNGKLIIKPSKANVINFLKNMRKTIMSNVAAKTENLIRILNPKIVGWANYYRHVASSSTFSKIDSEIYLALDRWIRRRHPKKSKRWLKTKYFRCARFSNWQFFSETKENGKTKILDLRKASQISIRRHVKIIGSAHPYNPEYKDYFVKRNERKGTVSKLAPELFSKIAGR